MNSVDEPLAVRFGRRSTRGLILGFSVARVLAIGVAATIAVAGLMVAGGFGFLLSAVLWAPIGASAFIRVAGRPVVEWVGVGGQYGGRKSLGQTEYRARVFPPRPAGTLALGGDAASLRFYVDVESGAALVHDPHRHMLSAAVSISHPAFVLLDRDEQSQRVSRWGRVLAGLGQSGTLAACQILEATVTDRGDAIAQWYQQHGMHEDGWADAQYTALLDAVRLGSSTHRTTVSIALDMRRAARAVKAAGGGVTGGAAVLRQDMSSLVDGLRQSGLTVGNWLNERDMAAILRSAYDPTDGEPGHHDGGLEQAGPLAISEHWDHLHHDSAWSAVLWICDWPRIDVPPDFLHPLVFAQGVRRTLSILARPLPADLALRQLRKEKTEAVADQAQKARVGQIVDLSDAQEYQDLLERERSVISGHTDVEFTGIITVTASSKEELAAAQSIVIRAAGAAACDVRPLYGRQAQGFVLGALPLARSPF